MTEEELDAAVDVISAVDAGVLQLLKSAGEGCGSKDNKRTTWGTIREGKGWGANCLMYKRINLY